MANPYGDNGIFTLQEFKNRGVIKLAPDALVYISGDLKTEVITPANTKDVSFNDGISTLSIQNNVDPPGSSNASIEIITPIYGEGSKYWIIFRDGDTGKKISWVPWIVPMMEVKIFLKGRFMVGDSPRYYPAFWGFITNVEENYSGGVYKINLSCADMLHWWS